MRCIARYMAMLSFCIIALACERRPLTTADYTVIVNLEIEKDVVNYDVTKDPSLMRCIFYDSHTGAFVTQTFLPATGGQVSLVPAREYDVLVYNFDTESTWLEGENWFQNLGDGGDSHPVPFSSHAAVCKTSETGWATFYDAENALRFKGVKAYTGKIVGQWLTLTEVEEIPAATAVILEGTYYNKVVLDGAAEVEGNDLCGATADFATTGAEYVFDKKEDAPAFYKASEGTTIVAGTVYLYVADSEVEAYILDLEGNADSIEGIEADHNASVVIFDLAGRRVQKAQKGIYIVNGKKIAVQ